MRQRVAQDVGKARGTDPVAQMFLKNLRLWQSAADLAKLLAAPLAIAPADFQLGWTVVH